MQQINTLTNDADQLMIVPLADGSELQLEFIYRPAIQRWVVNVSHPLLELKGFNVCLGPNILRQWRNLVPFGLAITATDGLDPVDISDFVTGRVSVFILSAAEVQQVEDEILNAPVLEDA